MPTWTKADLIAYEQRRKNSVANSGLCAPKPECIEGVPLERAKKRKGQSGVGVIGRARIIFRVFSQRPLDWDNYRLKDIQDCLRHAGLLDGDDWNQLQGEVVSEKAHSKAEERTEVEIEACQPSPKA